MLEVIRNGLEKTWAKVVLGIIVVPFALFGIDSYLNSMGNNVTVATVNNFEVTAQDFQRSMTLLQERLDAEGQDRSLLQSPEFRKSIIESLIDNQLIKGAVDKYNFRISDSQLATYIVGMPDFQENGKFSQERYDQIVQFNGLTPKKLEERVRGDMATQQVQGTIANLIYYPKKEVDKIAELVYQKRHVKLFDMLLMDYEEKVEVSDDDINKFYTENTSSFIRPDQVKIDFVVYSVANIVPLVEVLDDEIKTFYQENKQNYEGTEERSASHILFLADQTASEDERIKIKEKASEVLSSLKKDPKKFEELAIEYSQDPESAKNGGSLGFFKRGMMVKEFEEAVYAMKKNNISELIQTDFGFHIIRLDDVKGDQVSFDDVKPQIKGELIFQKALEVYNTNADDFSNLVYEQKESLDPVIEKYDLEVQQSPWLSRQDAEQFFNNPVFSDSVFDKNIMDNKFNTPAIEVSPNNLVSARVVDFRESKTKELDEVKDEIKDFLSKRNAQEDLINEGNKLVEGLQNNGTKEPDWIDELVIDRSDKQGLSDIIAEEIFKMNTSKLPAYSGIFDPKGEFMVIKLDKIDNETIIEEDANFFYDEFMSALDKEVEKAYLDDLRENSKIKINNQFLQFNGQ
jgi:peptidyl-prolyl cis-trans isomerase D